MSENNMKMKSRLQDIIKEYTDELSHESDCSAEDGIQGDSILFRDLDTTSQLRYIAEKEKENSSKDDLPVSLNHRP
jgi:hypothetical protein